MNSNLARFIFEQGARLRNPSLFEQYEFLKTTEFASQKELENLQLENAQRFLRWAETHSPYYKNLFGKIGFKSNNLGSLEDLKTIPEINKETLISENAAIHTQGLSEHCRLAETSGTSGAALSFKRNERWDSLNRATMMRSYDWYGVKPWERNGYLWGYNIQGTQAMKTQLLDKLQNRFRLFDYSQDGIYEFSKKLVSAQFLSGYSSMIYEIAKLLNDHQISIPNLKLVKGTSEMILNIYKEESKKVFGRTITSEYGAAEAGLIAFECPHGEMHINIENVIVETNQHGNAIITNLASESFPIIRYNLGDFIVVENSNCECGRKHPIIKEIAGRKGKSVIGDKQKYPALTFYYIFKNIAVNYGILINYKAIQRYPGLVNIYIEGTNDPKIVALIDKESKKYFKSDVELTIEFSRTIKTKNKKQQYFESML